jgi:glycosyltransferase involved in cell wall biosynthesis
MEKRTGIPKVSVVMAVYNGEKYVHESIDSILCQTFDDFEFIIINDASTDITPEILRSYKDPRIIILNNPENIGLTRSLNRGLKFARGEYIARMDADDISLPNRFECQVAYLDAHLEVGLLATSFLFIDESGNDKMISRPATDQQFKEKLMKGNQFCHGVVMFRRACIDKIGGYREEYRYAQDYDLWLRIMEKYGVASLDEVLFKYRINFSSISVTRLAKQNALHSIARECARQRKLCLPENLGAADDISRNEDYQPSWRKKMLARKAMSEYHIMWGRSYLTHNIKSARQEFFKAIRTFPLNHRAWFYTAASLMGATIISHIKHFLHDLRKLRASQ